MTTHTFTCGDLDVQCGWDRPLQYFYLNVTRGDQLVYAQLDDPDAQAGPYGGGLTITQLSAKFDGLGVAVPDGLTDALRHDQYGDAGNQSVHWNPVP